ncbi:MAG: magnesium transporter [Planctomycetes bacterium]|nr:magnesium transporter [Planctomycetota bacterium]
MITGQQYFLFLTNLLGKKLYREKSRKFVGKIVDIIAHSKEIYPEVNKLITKRGLFHDKGVVLWEDILPFELPVTKLWVKEETIVNPVNIANGKDLMLKDTFLDKQIVDVSGCKVVRVNDLHLLKEQNKIWVVHMDIGFRALSRRLGWEKRLDGIMEWIFSYKLPEQFVSWKHVQQLPGSSDHFGLAPIQLKSTSQRLNELHPADLADILQDLDRYERLAMFRSLDIKTAAEVLVELPIERQRRIIENLDREKRANLIALMLPDKAADLLSHLPPKRREEMLKPLPANVSDSIKKLMVHPDQTAGSLMTDKFIALPPEMTVEQSFAKIKELAPNVQALYYAYVVDANQVLLGVVTLRRLLSAAPTAKLSEIMNTRAVKIKPNASEQKAAKLFLKYSFGAIPVVDNQNKLLGIIMFKDAVDRVVSAVVESRK